MITVISGLTGSGKTFLMSRLALKRRKEGNLIHANMAFTFPNNNEGVFRWYALSELYNLTNGVICIDEGQKLFGNRMWPFLPISFADKIASTRHEFLDVITTTQDFAHIDVKVRDNVHELYHCQSLFRFPRNDRYKPIIQVIRVTHKRRSFDDFVSVKWTTAGKSLKFISKYWTKDLYNTYANINLSHFICQIKRDKNKWQILLTARQLVNNRGGR